METFLLRVWRPADPDEPTQARLNGLVLHVATGWERAFRSSAELGEFLASWPCSALAMRTSAALERASTQRDAVADAPTESRRTP
jgi:hypothetical protein